MKNERAAWEELLSSASRLQKILPDAVLVGGTAAALHVHHRASFDADHVLLNLREHFDAVLKDLESAAGWETARIRPPVLILGKLDGIDTGIRQLIRKEPLETEEIQISEGATITVPTMGEILRIKAALILRRNATRDYLDFTALADGLGDSGTCEAMSRFDELYPQDNGESALMQLQTQLADPKPYDLEGIDLSAYRHLQSKWHSWDTVKNVCIQISQVLAKELEQPLKEELKKCPRPEEERLRIITKLQNRFGSNIIVTGAQRGKTYGGEIVITTEDFAAQKIARGHIVLHRIRELPEPPQIGRKVKITRGKEGKSIVVEIVEETDRENGIER